MSDFSQSDIVILCGGLGKRLRAEIGETQKVMAPVEGKPFLEVLLGHLLAQGFLRIVLCTGYKAETVEGYFTKKSAEGLQIVFSQETEPLGTGGAVKHAKDLITTEEFFVLNGDSFCSLDFSELYRAHKTKKALATIAVSEVKESDDFGSISLGQDGKILGFAEKIKNDSQAVSFVNAGIYCFNKDVFSSMPLKDQFSLEKEFFPFLVSKRFFGFKIEGEFFDIGTPDRYQKVREKIK